MQSRQRFGTLSQRIQAASRIPTWAFYVNGDLLQCHLNKHQIGEPKAVSMEISPKLFDDFFTEWNAHPQQRPPYVETWQIPHASKNKHEWTSTYIRTHTFFCERRCTNTSFRCIDVRTIFSKRGDRPLLRLTFSSLQPYTSAHRHKCKHARRHTDERTQACLRAHMSCFQMYCTAMLAALITTLIVMKDSTVETSP